jgi:hypothetical protein
VRLSVGDRVPNCEVDSLDEEVVLKDYDALVGCGMRRRGGVGELGGGVEDCFEGGLVGYRLDCAGVNAPVWRWRR